MAIPNLRAALGGAWSTHWAIWLGILPASVLFAVYREQALEPEHAGLSVISGVLQHLAMGLIVVGGGALLRRRRSILPIAAVAALWGSACVAGALVAFAFSARFYGSASSPIADTIIGLALIATWIPVAIFAIAQLDQRRLLLAARDITTDALIEERAEGRVTAQQLQSRLLATVTAQLTPVLADLENSLNAARGAITGDTATELGARISRVHDETAELVERDGPPLHSGVRPERAQRVTFRRAFALSTAPPARIAGLVTLAALAAVVPDTYRVFGPVAAAQGAIAITSSGVLLAALPAAFARWAARGKGMTHLRATIVLQVFAVIAAVIILDVLPPSIWAGAQWQVLPMTLMALALAHTMYSIAFVVADANATDEKELRNASAELDTLRERRAERSRHARERMAQLIHGPIQGRLAACVMALNFHAEIVATDPPRAEVMLDSVIEHLKGVTAELRKLGTYPEQISPHER
ncbi:hypothetical protein [Microcella sp.]|uniref:hypothetical protein n=1 Tax=Microcella sp. TaxID=1913979 RepID=UPI00391CB4F5